MTPEQIKEFEEYMKQKAEARRIKYPVEVSGIDFDVKIGVSSKSFFGSLGSEKGPGTFVSIRSCKKEHGDKTRLGLLIGYVPIHAGVEFSKETKRLKFSVSGDNPAIFVFDLNEVVLGCESFWGAIESEKQLREITNDDIQNVWYIKALKQLAEKKKEYPDPLGMTVGNMETQEEFWICQHCHDNHHEECTGMARDVDMEESFACECEVKKAHPKRK